VLGRDKKACLADETTAQDTLKQNWSKYAASDKSDCVGMVKTGGPASYVELLSCVEILRDARNIRNADALESDNESVSTRRGRDNARPVRARRRHSTWAALHDLDDDHPQAGRSFRRACAMDLEGIVSKRLTAPYRSVPALDQGQEPDSPAMVRAREGRW
jgi:hypothetical protein